MKMARRLWTLFQETVYVQHSIEQDRLRTITGNNDRYDRLIAHRDKRANATQILSQFLFATGQRASSQISEIGFMRVPACT